MSEAIFNNIMYAWICVAIIIFIILLKITAPYGRHSTKTWGPMINNRMGWIIMELPALASFTVLVAIGKANGNNMIWFFFALWVLHYINRDLVYPLRIKTKGKMMPLVIMLMALFFNFVNGFLNGYWFGFLSPGYDISWLKDPRFIIGISLFIFGMITNLVTDEKLLKLRKNSGTGYSIPHGRLYKYISCPNFFGEIIEWAGFALMTWCLPTLTFFLWTFVNLVPRALSHHKWYKSHFKDYPSSRKAIIPFIL